MASAAARLRLLSNRALLSSDWFDGHKAARSSAINELHATVNLREERIVAAASDVQSGLERCPALPHNDGTASDQLAAECLNSEPLSI
jgi:hypothetical protein